MVEQVIAHRWASNPVPALIIETDQDRLYIVSPALLSQRYITIQGATLLLVAQWLKATSVVAELEERLEYPDEESIGSSKLLLGLVVQILTQMAKA